MNHVRSLMRPAGRRAAAVLLAAAALYAVPYSTLRLPGVFDGPLDSPGVLQLLAVCLLFAGLALSYDLLFGHTGIMSFGHGLFVTGGMYVTTILVNHAGYGLVPAALAGLGVGLAAALVLGSVALRVDGIGFAMVTLAFGQAVSLLVVSGSPALTGGEQGQTLNAGAVPAALSGVRNTANLYWLALGYLAVCAAVLWWLTTSVPGRVMRAVKENERRVEVLGLNPYLFKLLAFVVAGLLATGGGVVYLLLLGGATPVVAGSDFTLGLLVMVVLGGAGRRWGVVAGAVLYAYADQSLTRLSGSASVAALPGALRGPLQQPLFLLGVCFVAVVFFLPGGLATLPARLRASKTRVGHGVRTRNGRRAQRAGSRHSGLSADASATQPRSPIRRSAPQAGPNVLPGHNAASSTGAAEEGVTPHG
ncbi:branched-chain amino acid ABC transporter permease [Actinocrinis puniceicyclus]|uniref:Branched-chain amino acid ABC transporter permease n=1 Tax=Actinocrinis puniceicyclus TaxID=977794 RepID=A0A8J7WJV7_9ACTN|nr:branched-chain amino acid ABC transporter permease [Actinocrinis puniceicyclus]MBS2962673.1 branched-chain amino acid ABC transporter permease [Actinocrinis puniceicyclus]